MARRLHVGLWMEPLWKPLLHLEGKEWPADRIDRVDRLNWDGGLLHCLWVHRQGALCGHVQADDQDV